MNRELRCLGVELSSIPVPVCQSLSTTSHGCLRMPAVEAEHGRPTSKETAARMDFRHSRIMKELYSRSRTPGKSHSHQRPRCEVGAGAGVSTHSGHRLPRSQVRLYKFQASELLPLQYVILKGEGTKTHQKRPQYFGPL